MPGPGLDLIGDEEIAEVTDALRTRHLSRFACTTTSSTCSPDGRRSAVAARSTAVSTATAAPGYRQGILPAADALLARSMSIGIGIVDPNLAPYELRVTDDTEAALRCAERRREAAAPVLGA